MENSKRGNIPMQEKLKLSKSQGASTPAELKCVQNVPYASAVGSIMNTKDMFLFYGGDLKRELRVSCYTDAGYLTDADDLKSQTGYVFVLNCGAVDWKSAKITKGARHLRAKVHYLREVIEYGDVKLRKVHTDDNLADLFAKALAFSKYSEHTRNIRMLLATGHKDGSRGCLGSLNLVDEGKDSSDKPKRCCDKIKDKTGLIVTGSCHEEQSNQSTEKEDSRPSWRHKVMASPQRTVRRDNLHRLRTSMTQYSVLKSCSACSMVFTGDIYGDHVVSCASHIGIKHRHNIVRDTLVDICFRSGISAGKEVDIGLSDDLDKPLRPADMLLYSWDKGLDACVDLTESLPLTQTEMTDFVLGRVVTDATQCKRVKYEAKCAYIRYGFLPFSFPSFGELENDVIALLKRIQKFFVAQHIGARAAVHIFSRIRCYNYRGVGHFARNCTVRPRRRDAAYLQTQLLIAQKEEAGINLMAAVADLDEIEKVNANCILMTNLQQASTSGSQTDKAPIYDSDGSAEVYDYENCYDNEIFNMFTQNEQYTELLEPIPEQHQVPQNDNNVISEVTSVEKSRETVEQHPINFEETRALYDSLYHNLAIEVEKVNSVNRK
nr:hypothetical protein [Tanacetum cinerariifolium]